MPTSKPCGPTPPSASGELRRRADEARDTRLADARSKQAAIFDAQLTEEGKPDAARPKIIEGKVVKWAKDVCSLERESVIDTDKDRRIAARGPSQRLGTDVTLSRFARFQVGEWIEKPTAPDFASEVAKIAAESALFAVWRAWA